MKKLFKEIGEEISKYETEDICLDFYFIADDTNFKKQTTIKDYYRILLVNNTEDLTVEDLNNKLKELLNQGKINLQYDESQDILDSLNTEYNLSLTFEESSFYDDLDYFKHGLIVYDKKKNQFDLAENWDTTVMTYLYKKEHDFIAAMEVEILDNNLESPYVEVHFEELDEFEDVEVEDNNDEDSNYNEDDHEDDEEYSLKANDNPIIGLTVMQKNLVECTYAKKLENNKYLIIVSSKAAGHIDLAAIATEKELISYLQNESVSNIDKYMEAMNTKL